MGNGLWKEPREVDLAFEKGIMNESLREKLADLAHRQWSGWMRHLFYCDGMVYQDLEQWPGKRRKGSGRQSIAEVLTWLPRIAAALDHVHEEGMIHRDVKPGNILFDEKGNPALSDFGIVKACEQARGGLTATGQSPSPAAPPPP